MESLYRFPRSCKFAKSLNLDKENEISKFFKKNVIRWFKLYLSERKSKINVSTSYSSLLNLKRGIPQGFIPGRLLFLLRINNLSQAIASVLLLCADDTCIIFKYKIVLTEIEKELLRNFSSFCDSLFDNKLSKYLGKDKTKPISFGTKHKLRNAKDLNTLYSDTEIKYYAELSILGAS